MIGTVVPSQLILIHEHKKNFSLQPSGQGILLNGEMILDASKSVSF